MSDNSVDEGLPPPQLAALGLQHVLVMYAGAVAVPLILAGAAGLPPDQRALLISADIFCCGLATLIQAYGLPFIGIRLPVMMGVTFASVGPMTAMIAAAKAAGGTGFAPATALTTIYGAVIAAGVFAFLVAPLMGSLMRLFPPVVTGTIILVIGVSLMRIGIGWAEGPLPVMVPDVVDGVAKGMKLNPARDTLDASRCLCWCWWSFSARRNSPKGSSPTSRSSSASSQARSSPRSWARCRSRTSAKPIGSAW